VILHPFILKKINKMRHCLVLRVPLHIYNVVDSIFILYIVHKLKTQKYLLFLWLIAFNSLIKG
jgi:hypothetical protein